MDLLEIVNIKSKIERKKRMNSEYQELAKLVEKFVDRKFTPSIPKEAEKRIKEELQMIKKCKNAYQYLIAYKISQKTKIDRKIMIDRVCGSSYIAYLLGITFVNPLEYSIPYEDGFNTITFDLEFEESYFEKMKSYALIISREYNIFAKTIEDLKKYNIYLGTSFYANILEQLEKRTKINRNSIFLKDRLIYESFHNQNLSLLMDERTRKSKLLQDKLFSIQTLSELAEFLSLERSTFAYPLEKNNYFSFFPIYKEDIYFYLCSHNLKELAIEIMNFVYRGDSSREKEKWNNYAFIMKEHEIADDYIDYCKNIYFLYPKSYCYNRAILYVWLAYYKIYYPQIYKEVRGI